MTNPTKPLSAEKEAMMIEIADWFNAEGLNFGASNRFNKQCPKLMSFLEEGLDHDD